MCVGTHISCEAYAGRSMRCPSRSRSNSFSTGTDGYGLPPNENISHSSTPYDQLNTHTHTHPFNGPFSRTTWVSWYQKGKTNLDFTEARDSKWQWHQLSHMQVCTSLQTDNHASTIDVNKKLSYHRGTARCVELVEILPIAMQQCRNYLYDKS